MIKILLLIITIGTFAITGLKITTDEEENENVKFSFNKKQFATVIPLALFLVSNFFVIIPYNTVGIQYSPFSGVKTETLAEGFNQKGFFDIIHKMNTEVHTKELTGITGQTKDSQYLTMDIDVKYKVNTENAYEVFRQFRNLEYVDEEFIEPATQRAIDAVTTQYNIIEALGEKRNEVYQKVEEELRIRFMEAGIRFYSITFIDTDGGEEIEAAIAAEAVAKKEVETAEQERLKAEIDSQKRVVEAQADFEKAKIEAETQIVKAKAEAEANKLISESITQGLIDKIEAEARLKHGWVVAEGSTAIVDARE